MKILLITAKEYFPQNAGDIINSFGLLKELSCVSSISLINILDKVKYEAKEINELKQYTQALHIINETFYSNNVALCISYFTSQPFFVARRSKRKKIKQEITSLIHSIEPEVILWDHMRTTSYFTRNDAKLNILFEHNDESVIYAQKEKLYPRIFRPLLKLQTAMLKSHNESIHKQVNRIVYVSEKDIKPPYIKRKRYLKYMMADFPAKPYYVKQNKCITLLFIGTLDWFPNTAGILWFANNVMPLLGENYQLNIVGKNPSKDFEKQIQGYKNIVLYSNVPTTIPFYNDADIFISPIFKGSGINIKMLEACANAIPIVTSSFSKKGYEGLEFLPTADTPSEFRDQLKVLENPERRKYLSGLTQTWYQVYRTCKSESIINTFLSEE